MANRLSALPRSQQVQRPSDAGRKPKTRLTSVWMDDQGGAPTIFRRGTVGEPGDFGFNVFHGDGDGWLQI